MSETGRHPYEPGLGGAGWCWHGAREAAASGDSSRFCGRPDSDLIHGDPDARMVMTVLLASPNRDAPGALLSAAKAYAALVSSRERTAQHAADQADQPPEGEHHG